jgi:FkbM family methyltransferase
VRPARVSGSDAPELNYFANRRGFLKSNSRGTKGEDSMKSTVPIPDHLLRRVELTVSCHDADELPRVENAGGFAKHKGHDVQIMHNGIRVLRGGYYGEWTADIIQRLRGVHEPQEEKAVAAVFERLAAKPQSDEPLVCVELGSFWAYYSLWFLEEFNDGRVVCLEPDPAYLQVGVTNFALNDRQGTFLPGAVGSVADTDTDFIAESDGLSRVTRLYTLESLMAETRLDRVDVLFVDIQGAEVPLLEGAQQLLRSGKVRFIVVSTHDMATTGSSLTHRYAEQLLVTAGAHIICEHSVPESFSADGLIVASFFEADKDMVVDISFARAIDSCVGEWEPRIDELTHLLEQERDKSQALNARLSAELEHVRALRESTSWRITSGFRWLSARARPRPSPKFVKVEPDAGNPQ